MNSPPEENPAPQASGNRAQEGSFSNTELSLYPARPQGELKFPAQAKWRSNNPQKLWAQRSLRAALKLWIVTPKPCQRCGAEAAEAHHPSYDRPAFVIWLCRRCRRGEHRRKGGAR
jgi:hypothetical protein